MWVSKQSTTKNHRELSWVTGQQPPPSQPHSPLCAGAAAQLAEGQRNSGCWWGCKCRLWLKWGCLDRCILSLPIFLPLKQKELRDAKIQQTSKSFSFYFPCKGKYLKSGICTLSALALGFGKCCCNDRTTCTEVPGHWPPWITALDGTVGAHPVLQKTQVSSES